MKIERYISLVVVLVVGLFLVNASGPETTIAQGQAPVVPTCVPASAPVNPWCVPATSGAGVTGTFCTTEPVRPARTVVRSSDSLLDVVGSILAAPFVVAQRVLTGCP